MKKGDSQPQLTDGTMMAIDIFMAKVGADKTVFGAIMGIMILREKQGARRIASSLLITAGVITLGFS